MRQHESGIVFIVINRRCQGMTPGCTTSCLFVVVYSTVGRIHGCTPSRWELAVVGRLLVVSWRWWRWRCRRYGRCFRIRCGWTPSRHLKKLTGDLKKWACSHCCSSCCVGWPRLGAGPSFWRFSNFSFFFSNFKLTHCARFSVRRLDEANLVSGLHIHASGSEINNAQTV